MIVMHKQSRWLKSISARIPAGRLVLLGAITIVLFWPSHGLYAQSTPPAGTTHSVTLTWQAPSPVGGSGTVKGYNLYRATTGVNYAKINSALITGLTTTDAVVVSGTAYGYCATTVDSANNESPCTIPVSAAIPSNPNIPTGLTAAAQ